MIKIERTQPEPCGLEKQRYAGTYNIPSVRAQLEKDFHVKCYICGASVCGGFEIEHLKPHHGGTDEISRRRKFDWNNLFMSCGNCNRIKNRAEFEENIIDCCKKDPEMLIRHEVGRGKIRAVARKSAPDQTEADTTARLITECFNYAKESQAAENCEKKRRVLKSLAIELYKKLRRYRALRDDPQTCTGTECTQAKYDVLDLIGIECEYAAFLRTIVRDRLDMFPEFEAEVGADPEKGVHSR